MIRRPPRSTRTDTLFPYTTLFRSFMPYSKAGMVKNATKEAMVNMEAENGGVRVRAYVTAAYPEAQIRLLHHGEELFDVRADLSPGQDFDRFIRLQEWIPEHFQELRIEIREGDGTILVAWQPEKAGEQDNPPPATAAPLPEAVQTI